MCCVAMIWIGPFDLGGQVAPGGGSLNVQLANLRSDVDRLDQLVRSMRLEMEALQRENRQLRDAVERQLTAQSGTFVTAEELARVLGDFERRVQATNERARREIVEDVSKEVETLAEQTQRAITALSRSVASQPQLQQVVTFNDDFPSTGVTYTVKRGDTLGRIAREHGSRVDWIRNANRLATDTIFPGQELFIPIQR